MVTHLVGFTGDAQEGALALNALGEVLLTADVVAAEELLHGEEQRGLAVALHHILQLLVAPGIVEAPIWVEVHVAQALNDAQAALHQWIRIAVHHIHKAGIGSVQAHNGVRVCEEWCRRIQSRNAAQFQSEVALQVVARVAREMRAQGVPHDVHLVQVGQTQLLIQHVHHVRRDGTYQANVRHSLDIRRTCAATPVNQHYSAFTFLAVVQQRLGHLQHPGYIARLEVAVHQHVDPTVRIDAHALHAVRIIEIDVLRLIQGASCVQRVVWLDLRRLLRMHADRAGHRVPRPIDGETTVDPKALHLVDVCRRRRAINIK